MGIKCNTDSYKIITKIHSDENNSKRMSIQDVLFNIIMNNLLCILAYFVVNNESHSNKILKIFKIAQFQLLQNERKHGPILYGKLRFRMKWQGNMRRNQKPTRKKEKKEKSWKQTCETRGTNSFGLPPANTTTWKSMATAL